MHDMRCDAMRWNESESVKIETKNSELVCVWISCSHVLLLPLLQKKNVAAMNIVVK